MGKKKVILITYESTCEEARKDLKSQSLTIWYFNAGNR